ncbi:MAG TPA: ankyrin repeat domain-containing protein [Flavobacterium sp.]
MKKLIVFGLLLMTTLSFSQDVFEIARSGSVTEAEALLKNNPQAFNAVSPEGFSPLLLACYRGNSEVAKLLIKNGSDVNGKSNMGTPLMAAVVKGNSEIAQLLLNNRADPNSTDSNGTTALMYAAQFKNADLVQMLLKHKADKSKVDKNGKTAFEYAAFSENETIINLLK